MTAVEVGMFEMPRFSITVAPENALLQMWDLVEAIHVELTNKGLEVLVFEPPPEDLPCETFVIEDSKER